MRNISRAALGSVAIGMVAALITAAPADAANTAHTADAADTATIDVPSDFVQQLSDTRATGHYEVVGSALHVWTEGSTSTDKVAEYVATKTPLADTGEPVLNYEATSGTIPPGFQLVVDFDDNGTPDGILVGEPASYGNDWWASNSSAQFVKDGAPSHTGGSGSENHGTLDEWRAAFPDAQVVAFGFSLGSGVQGDGMLNSIEFAGTTYTFRADVQLEGKNECKKGGWATSTMPEFKNQGDCVSHFARQK